MLHELTPSRICHAVSLTPSSRSHAISLTNSRRQASLMLSRVTSTARCHRQPTTAAPPTHRHATTFQYSTKSPLDFEPRWPDSRNDVNKKLKVSHTGMDVEISCCILFDLTLTKLWFSRNAFIGEDKEKFEVIWNSPLSWFP